MLAQFVHGFTVYSAKACLVNQLNLSTHSAHTRNKKGAEFLNGSEVDHFQNAVGKTKLRGIFQLLLSFERKQKLHLQRLNETRIVLKTRNCNLEANQ